MPQPKVFALVSHEIKSKRKRPVIILGNIQYRNLRSGEMIDCIQTINGQLIVDDDIEIMEKEQQLTFVLVVEKDTVFQVLIFSMI